MLEKGGKLARLPAWLQSGDARIKMPDAGPWLLNLGVHQAASPGPSSRKEGFRSNDEAIETGPLESTCSQFFFSIRRFLVAEEVTFNRLGPISSYPN